MKKRRKTLTKDEILDAIRKHRDTLLKYKVREIGLFGSIVKGEQEDRSDIDLIVDFEEPTVENFMGLSSFLLGKSFWEKGRNSHPGWRR